MADKAIVAVKKIWSTCVSCAESYSADIGEYTAGSGNTRIERRWLASFGGV
jgi:hypothetical protein